MRSKSPSELRTIVTQLFDYLKTHDELLDSESMALNEALKLLIIADCHLTNLSFKVLNPR